MPKLQPSVTAAATGLVLLAAASIPLSAQAASAQSIAQRIAVEGTVMDRRSDWSGGLIFTRTTVQVDRVMSGVAPALVEISELGGRVGDIAQVVIGQPALPRTPRLAVELARVGQSWRLVSALERVPSAQSTEAGDLLAAGSYVRTTTKDSTPPCEGDLIPVSWPTATVHYVLDEACSADTDVDSCETAVLASFNTWHSVECAYLAFAYDGRLANAPLGYLRNGTNVNVVKWIESDWPGPAEAQAVTLATIGCSTGRQLDADILLNGVSSTFTTLATPGEGKVDIQNTMTHEAGHLAGFAHSPDPESTMFITAVFDETLKSDLTADDAQGLCDVYPVGREPSTPDDGCACSASGRAAHPEWLAFAFVGALFLVATRARRRRRC